MINKTSYASWCIGKLPKGCSLCVKGQKLVLFISGKCRWRCFYCPLSEKRAGIDAVWANERRLSNVNAISEAIEEAKLSKARGAGITGGDPLLFISRVCRYARALKRVFGKNFHLHIYLPTLLVTKTKLRALAASGIDEVRFHPAFLKQNFDDELRKIAIARNFKWQVGIEIPALPGKEQTTIKFIEASLPFLDFININEVEVSDKNLEAMMALGYCTVKNGKKGFTSYTIEGSQEAALRILKWIDKKLKRKKQRIHYCSAATKNLFQYKNRLALRAKQILKPYDILTDRATLYRGALYLPGFEPAERYEESLQKLTFEERKRAAKELKSKIVLLKKLGLTKRFIAFDEARLRLLCPVGFAREFKEEIKAAGLLSALVEELPTYNFELLQLEFL